MPNITPNAGTPISNDSGLGNAASPQTGDSTDMSSWFGSEASTGKLLDVSPPTGYRSMEAPQLAEEVLQHLRQ